MKNRNEDEFGIITDNNHQFNSIEEARNYTKSLKDKLKRKASMMEFPVNAAMPEERLRFLEYCVSLMSKDNLPFTSDEHIKKCRAVLWLLIKGYTPGAITMYLKKNGHPFIKIDDVKKTIKEAVVMAKDAIGRVQNTKIPIIGV